MERKLKGHDTSGLDDHVKFLMLERDRQLQRQERKEQRKLQERKEQRELQERKRQDRTHERLLLYSKTAQGLRVQIADLQDRQASATAAELPALEREVKDKQAALADTIAGHELCLAAGEKAVTIGCPSLVKMTLFLWCSQNRHCTAKSRSRVHGVFCADDGFLNLNCSPHVCKGMGLHAAPSAGSACKIYVREGYEKLWENITTDNPFGQAIITGTAGIGKSTYRLFLLWKWMNGATDMVFDDVRINMEDTFIVVEKDGTARKIDQDILEQNARRSLGLLDPCHKLDCRKETRLKFLAVTTSASPLAGDDRKCSLSEMGKYAVVHVMGTWTEVELVKIFGPIEQDRLERFTIVCNDGIRYGVPRWFLYPEALIEGYLERSLTHCQRTGIKNWLLRDARDHSHDSNLPYRLFAIEENGMNKWKASGFISEGVWKMVCDWAELGTELDRKGFVNMMQNSESGGMVGNVFERWVRDGLSRNNEFVFRIDNENVSVSFDSAKSIRYNIRQYEAGANTGQIGNQANTGQIGNPAKRKRGRPKVLKDDEGDAENLDKVLLTGVVVFPQPNFGSIDAFGFSKDGKYFIMLQITKSKAHSKAELHHLEFLMQRAKLVNPNAEFVLVYLRPDDEIFTPPDSPVVRSKGVLICRGRMKEDFFMEFKQRIGRGFAAATPAAPPAADGSPANDEGDQGCGYRQGGDGGGDDSDNCKGERGEGNGDCDGGESERAKANALGEGNGGGGQGGGKGRKRRRSQRGGEREREGGEGQGKGGNSGQG